MSSNHSHRHRPSVLKPIPRLLLALLAPLSIFPVFAQPNSSVQSDGVPQYIGDATRLSIGIVNGGNVQGEISGVFKEDADSAWLGEVWAAQSSGGGKLSYHRLSNDAVQKYFVA
ncbi:MAG: hypothetical protein RIR79_559, partial [Pseudomonadota bacterium]